MLCLKFEFSFCWPFYQIQLKWWENHLVNWMCWRFPQGSIIMFMIFYLQINRLKSFWQNLFPINWKEKQLTINPCNIIIHFSSSSNFQSSPNKRLNKALGNAQASISHCHSAYLLATQELPRIPKIYIWVINEWFCCFDPITILEYLPVNSILSICINGINFLINPSMSADLWLKVLWKAI